MVDLEKQLQANQYFGVILVGEDRELWSFLKVFILEMVHFLFGTKMWPFNACDCFIGHFVGRLVCNVKKMSEIMVKICGSVTHVYYLFILKFSQIRFRLDRHYTFSRICENFIMDISPDK